MKISKAVLMSIFAFFLGVIAAIGVYFATCADVAWSEYIEQRLAPNVVLALSSVTALYFFLKPIIKDAGIVLSKFSTATHDVNKSVEMNSEAKRIIAEQNEKILSFESRLDDISKLLTEEFSKLESTCAQTECIAKMGFMAQEELIRDGVAAKIAKVGVEDE